MKRTIISLLLLVMSMMSIAQDIVMPFRARIYNKEWDVFIQMDLYAETVPIPGQSVLGEVYGYLKRTTDGRVWPIMEVEFSEDGKKAQLEMIDDYGSEDLTAELTLNEDSTYTFKQLTGSTIKLAINNKWVKLPKVLNFKKQ